METRALLGEAMPAQHSALTDKTTEPYKRHRMKSDIQNTRKLRTEHGWTRSILC